MTNFFSDDRFLDALVAAHAPGKDYEPGWVRHGGHCYRVAFVDGKPWLWKPFVDFLEPGSPPPEARPKSVPFMPAVSTKRTVAEQWDRENVPEGMQASPTIDFRAFETFELYRESARKRGSCFGSTAKKREKKATKDLGELRYLFHDPDPKLVELAMAWKSAQYIAGGLTDLFDYQGTRRLFFELLERGSLKTSVLYAGERATAIHLGLLDDDGRFYYWLPAYDGELRTYSVGSLLQERLITSCYESGHTEFDFLLGNEDYKWTYATHNRIVERVGERFFYDRLWKPVRGHIMPLVRRSERLHLALRGAKRALKKYREG